MVWSTVVVEGAVVTVDCIVGVVGDMVVVVGEVT